MPSRNFRVKPTEYPKLPFHTIRSTQLVSSVVVACIMVYFLKELARSHYNLPWTFILLLTVSLLTIACLTTTAVLHWSRGLDPKLNIVLNFSLAVLWTTAFALLSWWSSGTLAHVCSKAEWRNELGLSICRLYKALFSFSLFGLLATILAFVLDGHVRRRAHTKGRFQQLRVLDGDGKAGAVDARRGVPEDANPNLMIAKTDGMGRGGEGYGVPERQFVYDESLGYHGSSGPIGRKSVDDRT